jgi:hypothetical protein
LWGQHQRNLVARRVLNPAVMSNRNLTDSKHPHAMRSLKGTALLSTVSLLVPTLAHAESAAIDNPSGGPALAAAQGSHGRTEASPERPTRRAEAPGPRAYWLSLRPSLGVGEGDVALGMRLGASSEYWFNDYLGVGLQAALFGQSSGILATRGQAAGMIAPALALRSSSGSDYLIGTLGAGFANVSLDDASQCSFFYEGADNDCHMRRDYAGYAASASFGYVGHPGRSSFEIAPVIRFDGVSDLRGREAMNYLVTLNLELGIGLRR